MTRYKPLNIVTQVIRNLSDISTDNVLKVLSEEKHGSYIMDGEDDDTRFIDLDRYICNLYRISIQDSVHYPLNYDKAYLYFREKLDDQSVIRVLCHDVDVRSDVIYNAACLLADIIVEHGNTVDKNEIGYWCRTLGNKSK